MKKSKTGITKNVRILELPLHLLFDILSRLTIETVFSCKCVCKLLLEILTDPHFVELHLTKAPSGLIIQDRANISDTLLVYNNRHELYDSLPCQSLAVPTKESHLYNSRVSISGSCNGLICLRYSYENFQSHIYYICNPILGEFWALPPDVQNSVVEYVGFGFCPKTKQYKVLRFVTPSICSIHTLGTDCWRQIGEVPYPRTSPFGCSFNGNLHWITGSTKRSNFICSFNLETQRFSYMFPPVLFLGNSLQFNPNVLMFMTINVGLLDGLFCFYSVTEGNFEAFVMKDYGPEGCWTKMFSVQLSSSPFNLKRVMVRFLNNGELIIQELNGTNHTLICCDLRKGTKRYMLAEKKHMSFGVSSFVPSFISLKDMAGAAGGNVEVVQWKMGHNLWSENCFKFIR